MRELSERLIVYEIQRNKSSGTKPVAGFLVVEKLRPQLTTLMGNVGFGALLLRARALASAEVSWLRKLKIKADGSFEGLHEIEEEVDAGEIFEGKVALLAQLFGLLLAFIGEILTLHLVSEVWPKLPLDDLDFGRRDENEK